jgi:hypothetical protein
MAMIKDKVTFCKSCGKWHRQSYDCSPVDTAKEAEVVQNLAEPTPVDETEASVTPAEAEVTLVEVEAEDVDLVEKVIDVVEDGSVTPKENQEVLKEVSKTAKKRKPRKPKAEAPVEEPVEPIE